MKVIRQKYSTPFKPVANNVSIILGYFDGVHLGHQLLIEVARENAKNPLVIMTFAKPVASFIKNQKSDDVLTSLDDRFKLISRYNVDYYYVLDIDEKFLNLSAEEFIKILQSMNVKEIFCGVDYRFGKGRLGDPNLLAKYFTVFSVPTVNKFHEKVSSFDIKNRIKNGDLQHANDLLGHNYIITGTVIHGKELGRSIGFPTMNIKLSDNYVLPKFGVYKAVAYIEGMPHLSIVNVGLNPTVENREIPSIEVHVKEYHQQNYTETIQIEFLEFIREEKKFASIEELKKQIAEDTKRVFNENL